MAKDQPADVAHQARVAKMVKRVRQIHAMGVRAIRYLEKHASLTGFNAQPNVGPDAVRKARLFAEQFSTKELDEFCSLRTPDGMPLGWRHGAELARIGDRGLRKQLQKQAVEEGWTGDQLVQARKLHTGQRRSYAGRKVKGPASGELLLQQLVDETERWNKRYRQTWAPGGQLKLEDLTGRRRNGQAAHVKLLVGRARQALADMRAATEQADLDLRRLEWRL